MSSKNEGESNEDEVGVLAGLLDFHSDRAEAHASFLIACVFGIFALLAVVQNIENEWFIFFLTIPYIMLALVGFHCLQRFGFYTIMAEIYEKSLERHLECLTEEKTHPRIYVWKKEKDGEWKKLPAKKYETILLKSYGGILRRFKKPLPMKLSAIAIFGLPFVIVYLPKFIVAFLQFI